MLHIPREPLQDCLLLCTKSPHCSRAAAAARYPKASKPDAWAVDPRNESVLKSLENEISYGPGSMCSLWAPLFFCVHGGSNFCSRTLFSSESIQGKR